MPQSERSCRWQCAGVRRWTIIDRMPTDHDDEVQAVAVRTPAGDTEWALAIRREGRAWRLTLRSPDRVWTGAGLDCFKAQRDLRALLDVDGVLLGVNGARPNSWSSGVQCDMGQGRLTYLLELGVTGRPPQVPTLDAAPLDAVGTVAAQDEFQSRWVAGRRL